MASKIKVDQLETADGSGTIALQNQLSGMTTASLPALGSAQMPTGSVLQVVHGSYSTETSTTSGSTWVATGASIAITPTSASSKILVMFNQYIRIYAPSADQGAGYAIRRGTTTIWSTPQSYTTYIYMTGLEVDMRLYQSFNYLDSPNTTSATTYSTRMIEYGNGTTYAQHSSNPTMMTLIEIAG